MSRHTEDNVMPQANYTIKATEAIQGAFKLAADRETKAKQKVDA